MLRALATPLALVRHAAQRAKHPFPAPALKSVALLKRELANATDRLMRRLNAGGAREARRSLWRSAALRLRLAGVDAKAWSRYLVFACRRCAGRLCRLFQIAREIEDRATSRLAYGVLRTLEKELWLLQSNAPRTQPVANGGT